MHTHCAVDFKQSTIHRENRGLERIDAFSRKKRGIESW